MNLSLSFSRVANFCHRQEEQSANLPVLFLLTGRFLDYSPHRGDTLHHQGEIWHGGVDGLLLPAKLFHLHRLRGVSLRPQN